MLATMVVPRGLVAALLGILFMVSMLLNVLLENQLLRHRVGHSAKKDAAQIAPWPPKWDVKKFSSYTSRGKQLLIVLYVSYLVGALSLIKLLGLIRASW